MKKLWLAGLVICLVLSVSVVYAEEKSGRWEYGISMDEMTDQVSYYYATTQISDGLGKTSLSIFYDLRRKQIVMIISYSVSNTDMWMTMKEFAATKIRVDKNEVHELSIRSTKKGIWFTTIDISLLEEISSGQVLLVKAEGATLKKFSLDGSSKAIAFIIDKL